jgi:hypothetical protein
MIGGLAAQGTNASSLTLGLSTMTSGHRDGRGELQISNTASGALVDVIAKQPILRQRQSGRWRRRRDQLQRAKDRAEHINFGHV